MVLVGMATICLLTASLLRPNNFRLGGVFQFVEMSGFLAMCYFLKLLHTLMLLGLRNYFYYFLRNA